LIYKYKAETAILKCNYECNQMKNNDSLKNMVYFLCLLFCSNASSFAQTLVKSTVQSNPKWAEAKLDKKIKNAGWSVLEANNCAFSVKYLNVQNQLPLIATLSPPKESECEAVVASNYELLPNNILFANYEEERGGVAYLFLPTAKKLSWIKVVYLSGDEDSLVAKVQGSKIYLASSTDKFTLDIQPDGGFKIVDKISGYEDEIACSSKMRFKDGGGRGSDAKITVADGKIVALDISSYATNGQVGGAYFCNFDTANIFQSEPKSKIKFSKVGSVTTMRMKSVDEESVAHIKKINDTYVIEPKGISRDYCGFGAEWPASITLKAGIKNCNVVY
jgi:hypothetical protein